MHGQYEKSGKMNFYCNIYFTYLSHLFFFLPKLIYIFAVWFRSDCYDDEIEDENSNKRFSYIMPHRQQIVKDAFIWIGATSHPTGNYIFFTLLLYNIILISHDLPIFSYFSLCSSDRIGKRYHMRLAELKEDEYKKLQEKYPKLYKKWEEFEEERKQAQEQAKAADANKREDEEEDQNELRLLSLLNELSDDSEDEDQGEDEDDSTGRDVEER